MSGSRIGEDHQQALPLQCQLRYHRFQNIVLRIDEGVLDSGTHHYFLTRHEVESVAIGIYTFCQHTHHTGIPCRLACRKQAVIDNRYGLRLAGQLAGGCAEEHIRIRADTRLVLLGGSGYLLRCGEGIAILVSPRPLMGNRHIERELIARFEGGTRIGADARRSVHDTHIGSHTQTVLGGQFDAHLPIITLGIGVVIGRAGLYPCRRAVATRITHYIQYRDIRFGRTELVLIDHIAGYEGAEGVGLHHRAIAVGQRHTDGGEGVLPRRLRLDVGHGEPYGAVLAFVVELIALTGGGGHHTVAHQHAAATLRHTVQTLHRVIVIVVVLVRLCLKLIFAVEAENGIA